MYLKEIVTFEGSVTLYCLHGNLSIRTVKNLCPSFQKPPLPSKIADYAPASVASFLSTRKS